MSVTSCVDDMAKYEHFHDCVHANTDMYVVPFIVHIDLLLYMLLSNDMYGWVRKIVEWKYDTIDPKWSYCFRGLRQGFFGFIYCWYIY